MNSFEIEIKKLKKKNKRLKKERKVYKSLAIFYMVVGGLSLWLNILFLVL